MTREELARLALQVLDAQKRYFKTKGGGAGKFAALEESKALEKELRHEAERVLETRTLFD